MAALVPTTTQVASSATVVTLAAANPSRRQLIVENSSTATLYLKYGTGATTSAYTVSLAPGDLYEAPDVPATKNEVVRGPYDGVVTGIWTAANGFAMVTELS
jgi:hypothetical protein